MATNRSTPDAPWWATYAGRRQTIMTLSEPLTSFYRDHRVPRRDLWQGVTYFLLSPDAALVNIGTTANLERRLDAFRDASPVPLRLIHVIPGSYGTRDAIHTLLTGLRSHGDWFRIDAPTRAVLEQTGCPDTLDPAPPSTPPATDVPVRIDWPTPDTLAEHVPPGQLAVDAEIVAQWLDLPVAVVHDLARAKRLPTVRVGRQTRFPVAALLAAARRAHPASAAISAAMSDHHGVSCNPMSDGRVVDIRDLMRGV